MPSFHKLFVVVFVVVAANFLQITPPAAAARSLDFFGEELVKWAGYGEEKLSTVIISGEILCSATDAQRKPVSGAQVAVMCRTSRKARKLSTVRGMTDVSGKFQIDLPSHLHAIPNIDKVCYVRVVNLPEASPCREACGAKHNKPIALTSIHQGIRTYTTHNIHLSPPN